MRRLFILLSIIIVSVGAWAQDVKPDKPDARLDQKVTLEVSHTKLEDVCKYLTEKTGVTIKAGSGERDWKVRERKVTIQARDVKLDTLMHQISKLLGFYLSKSGKEGEWAYLYWQDKKSRDLEAEMLSAEKEAAAQRARKMCESAIDQASNALKLTPEEALKKKTEDPLLAYMGGTKSGRGFAQLLASLNGLQTERELLMRGQNTMIELSGAMQKAAMDAASGGIIAGEMKGQNKEFPGDLEPYQLTIMPVNEAENFEAGVLGVGGFIAISGVNPGQTPTTNGGNPFGQGDMMGVFLLADPDSKVSDLFASFLFDIESGVSAEEANRKINDEIKNPELLASVLAKDSPTEKDPPTDPRLTREVEISDKIGKSAGITDLNDKPENAGKTMAEISRALGVPVLFESFVKLMPVSIFVKPGKQPLYKVLIGLEKCDLGWELDDDALRIRPRNWALRRSYEIPESFIAHCKDLLEKQGELTLDDIGDIVIALTDGQIGNTLLADPDLGWLFNSIFGDLGQGKIIVRLYGSLTAPQKSVLTTEAGLPFSQLTGEQWDRVSSLISSGFGGVYVQDGSVRLKPDTNPAETQRRVHSYYFEISVQVADEAKPRMLPQTISVLGKEGVASRKKQQADMVERQRKAAEEQQKTEPAK